MKQVIIFILSLLTFSVAKADNVITTVNADAKSGDVITLPINLSNDRDVCAYQFDMVLPTGVTVVTDGVGTCQVALGSRTTSGRHTLMCAPQSDGSVRFLCYSLSNYTFSSTSGAVATVKLKVAENCAPGSFQVVIRNAIISSPDERLIHVPGTQVSSINVTSARLRGDVNGDGSVNTTDAVLVINYYLGKSNTIDYGAADMNNDGVINTTDAVLIINKYLNK